MPEIILPIVFCIALLILKKIQKKYLFALSARIAMAVMLITTAIAHVIFTDGMSMMVPAFIPYKTELVYITGLLEAAAAIGLLLPAYKKMTGYLLIVFFILLLPANIYAAIKQVNLESATFNGDGPSYLWYRIPLQLFFIAWVYFSCIRSFPNNKAFNENK